MASEHDPGSKPQLARMIRRNATLKVRPLGKHPRSFTDLYHSLLNASWPGLALWFAGSFTLFNLLFAGLYWLQADSIGWAVSPIVASHFLRSFFFSVQTVATIGYGNMYPATLYSNALVVVEMTFGILFFALATGIAFARFSRPTARILFSKVAVIAPVDGVPTLMVRAANQRHNLIFEAHAALSVLTDDPGGESPMRRFETLEPVRKANPAFALTWTIMHAIDGDSPLAPWLERSAAPDDAEVVVVLSGTNSSSGQIIHGRWDYGPGDIRFNARFADILGRADDGVRTIDYDRFHEVEPADDASDRRDDR